MKIVDLNVLIYATDARSAHHGSARPWLDEVMSSSETIGIPTAVAVGYIRLTTSSQVMNVPLDPSRSIAIVNGWLGRTNVTTPEPTSRHYVLLEELLSRVGAAGNLVSDAHLAALSIEHGAELCSYDRDFGRFPGVEWVDPAAI